MARHWEKPGFEVLRVAGECTAYSGVEAIAHRPTVGVGVGASPMRADRLPIDDAAIRVARVGVGGPAIG